MAKIINKSNRRIGLADIRLEPGESGEVDMSAANVRKHFFYQDGLIDLVDGKGGGKSAGGSASSQGGADDGQTGSEQA